MAKRVSVRRFKTDEVQGEGSFVILSSMTVNEIRALRKLGKDDEADVFEPGLKLLERHVQEWDWVGNDGKQLPLPKNDPSVIGLLTHEEAVFLSTLMVEAGSKNSESKSSKPSGQK